MINHPETMVYIAGKRVSRPVWALGTVNTNASGVARFYLTDDATAMGNNLFSVVHDWATDVQANVAVNSRTSTIGANYVEVTVTQLAFSGVTVLGINVLGSVTAVGVNNVPVKFMVVGE